MLTRVTAIEHHALRQTGKTHPSKVVCEKADGTLVELVAKFSAGCEQKEESLAPPVAFAVLLGSLFGGVTAVAAPPGPPSVPGVPSTPGGRTVNHDPIGALAHLPHSSSSSRFTAGAFGFFILSQSGERPDR
jgi:hypothetical protein